MLTAQLLEAKLACIGHVVRVAIAHDTTQQSKQTCRDKCRTVLRMHDFIVGAPLMRMSLQALLAHSVVPMSLPDALHVVRNRHKGCQLMNLGNEATASPALFWPNKSTPWLALKVSIVCGHEPILSHKYVLSMECFCYVLNISHSDLTDLPPWQNHSGTVLHPKHWAIKPQISSNLEGCRSI